MNTQTDESAWENLKRSVRPLKGKADRQPPEMPKILRAHRAPERELMTTLDLHGFTLEEAWNAVRRFIALHINAGSRTIRIITGKGLNNAGKIKNEISLWMETPAFTDQVRQTRWLNDGGVLELTLKRKKK